MYWKNSPRAHVSLLTGPEQKKVKIDVVNKVIDDYKDIPISFKIEEEVKIFPKGKREFAVLSVSSPELDSIRQQLHTRRNGKSYHITLAEKESECE